MSLLLGSGSWAPQQGDNKELESVGGARQAHLAVKGGWRNSVEGRGWRLCDVEMGRQGGEWRETGWVWPFETMCGVRHKQQ